MSDDRFNEAQAPRSRRNEAAIEAFNFAVLCFLGPTNVFATRSESKRNDELKQLCRQVPFQGGTLTVTLTFDGRSAAANDGMEYP